MQKLVLPNGLSVLLERRDSDSVAVEVSIGVGSDVESRKQAGVSHFLEHMLFNGSEKRPTALEITNEIERLGGMLNGSTSNEQTSVYAKVPSKHLDVLLDVLSDMILHPLFKKEEVEKERKIILNEIQLLKDDPKLYIWILLQERLYVKHPAKNPVYGRFEAISRLSREDLVAFHRKYYVPGNIAIAVVGDLKKNVFQVVERYFGGMAPGRAPKKVIPKEPKQLRRKTYKEKRKILQSYLVLAYKTPPRSHRDSYALDVIQAILGRRSSGRIFDEIRNKRGLAYDINVQNEALKTFGFFAVYVVADRKNLKKIVDIVLKELSNLRNLGLRDLEEAKMFIEGDFLLDNEDNLKRAEMLGFFNHTGTAEDALKYIRRIKKVSLDETKRVAKKYLSGNYTLVVVEEK